MPLKFFTSFRTFRKDASFKDVLSGIVLASMDIPQILGYTRIAGTPAVTGLYTALLPLSLFAMFGSSRHLVVAADSATAAIFSSALSGMAPYASHHYMELVSMVALLTSILLILARFFQLGFLGDFLSRTVLVGFLTGVGIQVSIAMLGEILGLQINARETILQIIQILNSLQNYNFFTFFISFLVVSCILISRYLFPKFPTPFFMVILGIALSYFFHFEKYSIELIGPISGGLPVLKFPKVSWLELLKLIPVSLSCFIVIIAQSSATSRVFALRHQERVDENADILGLSLANAAAGLSGTFVVNGSPTQTAMADLAGSRSQIAQLVFSGIVLFVLLFLTGPLQYLPRCILAGIVFTIAIGLIDLKGLVHIRRESPGEFQLAVLTAIVVALVGLNQGILLAVMLSLLRHVRHSYRPHSSILEPDQTGRWLPVPVKPGLETKPGLIVYQFGSDLFYANDNHFSDEVLSLIEHAPSPIKCFIVDAGAISDIDYSAAQSVLNLCSVLKQRSIQLIFGRVSVYLKADMNRHGILSAIGEKFVFSTLHEAIQATHET